MLNNFLLKQGNLQNDWSHGISSDTSFLKVWWTGTGRMPHARHSSVTLFLNWTGTAKIL